ncbi:PQQ-dependent sugar dehydrogenase [Runella sp.]|uniref:PQQ-dependent sugar dehydrogenase n=1 Tax=Runella sp. TaxID=1960881 RepID=UPI003D0C5851
MKPSKISALLSAVKTSLTKYHLSLCLCTVFNLIFTQLYSQAPTLSLELYQSGFNRPTDIRSAGDSRLFVSEIGGKIKIIQNNTLLSTPFLDISSKVYDKEWAGINSFAFHPDYAKNGRFYVLYVRKPDNVVQLSQFRKSDADSNQASPIETPLLTIPHILNVGHRGGAIHFGPDGYLYITTGDDADGGRGLIGDPLNNAQNLSKLFGKLLRIDVNSHNNTYAIPPDNPYQTNNDSIPDEIWARGLRNPWRLSFDRATGDLWMGDNGQDGWEEIDFLANGTPGGANFGWRCYEGNHRYVQPVCEDSTTLIFPIHEYAGYDNNGGMGESVIGGVVYRGQKFPAMYGYYIYADYITGKFWTLRRNLNNDHQNLSQPITLNNPVSFGEDTFGELYVISITNGNLYKIKAQSCPSSLKLTAFDPIKSNNTFKADHSINASNNISISANVIYSAQNYIELNPGFNAPKGSIFKAEIGDCPNNSLSGSTTQK